MTLRPTMFLRMTTLLGVLAFASCSSGDSQAELERLTADYELRVTELEQSVEELKDQRDAAAEAQRAAEGERDEALSQAEELRRLYDPEIQAQLALILDEAILEGCVVADAAGYAGEALPQSDVAVAQALDDLPESVALEVRSSIDRQPIVAKMTECHQAGQVRKAQEALFQPKGDGIWTVGLEIAAGKWRSTGTSGDCYWKRSPDGAPDDIIDNHFGSAGGSVTLRPGEEFETTRCGTWEFAG